MSDQEIHQKCSVNCFNGVWDLLDKAERSADDDRLMREMAHASLFHWLCRKDAKPTNLSIGLWQVSRVYAVLGQAEEAARYANECIEISKAPDPSAFCLGYAYEAAARAAKVAGDTERCREFVEKGVALLDSIIEHEDRDLLATDLDSLA